MDDSGDGRTRRFVLAGATRLTRNAPARGIGRAPRAADVPGVRRLLALLVSALLACVLAAPAGALDITITIINNSSNPSEPAVFQTPVGLQGQGNALAGSTCELRHLPGPALVCAADGVDGLVGGTAAQVLVECGYYDFTPHPGEARPACDVDAPLVKVAQSDVPDNMLSLLAALQP